VEREESSSFKDEPGVPDSPSDAIINLREARVTRSSPNYEAFSFRQEDLHLGDVCIFSLESWTILRRHSDLALLRKILY